MYTGPGSGRWGVGVKWVGRQERRSVTLALDANGELFFATNVEVCLCSPA